MLKKTLVISLVLVFVLSFSTVSLANDYKDQYTLSYNVAPSFPWGVGVNYFADIVEKRTDGRINIKPVGGSQLAGGDQTQVFSLVRNGSIDMAVESTINFSPQIKSMNIFSLPYFFEGYEELDAVQNGKAGQMILDQMDRLGVKAFGWGENGFRQITNNVRPIEEPSDLEGLKFRVVGSEIFIDTFKALGANPLTMNWGEATTGFQQGTVDGQENPTVGVLIPVKIWEFHDYMTAWDYVADPLVIAINKQVFNSFTEEDQEIVAKAAREALEFEKMLARYGMADGEAKKYIDEMIESGDDLGYAQDFLSNLSGEDGSFSPHGYLEQQGMEVIDLSPEQKQKFREKTQSVYDKWIERIGQDIYEAAQEDKEGVN